jgi:hypothetical protein
VALTDIRHDTSTGHQAWIDAPDPPDAAGHSELAIEPELP